MNRYIKCGEKFLKNCVFGGLAHSLDVKTCCYIKPYPEVTGYVIKYFCDNYPEVPENIVKAADYLLSIQDSETGGFPSFNCKHILYVFDTSQILVGLCAMYLKTGKIKYLIAAKNAGTFLLDSLEDAGAFKPIYNKNIKAWIVSEDTYRIWNGPYSGLMCKLIEGMKALNEITREKKYVDAIKKILMFYSKAEYIEFSHPLGYWLEGLLAGGNKNKVEEIIEEKIINRVDKQGYIAYTPNLPYAYVSGTIQLGIIFAKMGYMDIAFNIRNYGRLVQANHLSGGLFQYAKEDGKLDNHVHNEINSWGTKYFCELERLLET